MAEIPELDIFVEQMNELLKGKTVLRAESLQPKCLNIAPDRWRAAILGKTIGQSEHLGKWIKTELLPDYYFLLNVGMGADLRYVLPGEAPPAKYQIRFDFTDGSAFYCRYWWFGHAHVVRMDGLSDHVQTNGIGPYATGPEATTEFYARLVAGNPGKTIKGLLMDQRMVSGIGNAYMHDILFLARIHPMRKCRSLARDEVMRIRPAIVSVLSRAVEMGGMESDLYGHARTREDFNKLLMIGYKEGKECPICGGLIEKIKTGSTQGFICPACQKPA